jgi:hypothetical protein
MIYLSVVKMNSEGTHFDSNCWITERGCESVTEKSDPFLLYNINVELSSLIEK